LTQKCTSLPATIKNKKRKPSFHKFGKCSGNENGVKVALFIDFDKGRKANELIRNILEKKLF
jgi:hypothetical protein